MKKFIINISIFILSFLLFILPLDYYLSNKLKNTGNCEGEFDVWNDIYSGNLKCDIAIYGSSRAWVHINPEIFEDSFKLKTYNFGIDGHNFWLQNLRHLKLQKNNIKPKIIIHSVDVFTLQKRKELYNMSQFSPYMLWDFDIYNSTASYVGYSLLDYFIPLLRFRHNTNFITSLQTYNKPVRVKGFKGMHKEWNSDFENAIKINSSISINLDSATVRLYEFFLESCKLENIEVVIIYSPEYIDGQRYVSNRNDIMDLYKRLSVKYGIIFLDYSNNNLSYEKKYFYNSQHLNATGADVFTNILITDLKRINKINNVLSQCQNN